MDDTQTYDHDRIIKVNIEEEMKSSYIDYSMSVIVARALPDVRDGFKPVHRRILYGMLGIGNTSTSRQKIPSGIANVSTPPTKPNKKNSCLPLRRFIIAKIGIRIPPRLQGYIGHQSRIGLPFTSQ